VTPKPARPGRPPIKAREEVVPLAVCEWGPEGARKFDGNVGAMVIVDILSFSTCIDIAVSRGAIVYPFGFHDEAAAIEAARVLGAEVAGPRSSMQHRFSLSPASLALIPPDTKLVLPSPNGSAISAAARSVPVLTGCLRNARAVAKAAIDVAAGRSIAVIPAGERWPDGKLRPAIEDLIGAGAILDELELPCSPEADVALQAYRSARPHLSSMLRDCESGRELRDRGFPEDVEVAIKLNVSAAAPILVDGAYIARRP
jgi:2-phosphosulfolactate phosphatase